MTFRASPLAPALSGVIILALATNSVCAAPSVKGKRSQSAPAGSPVKYVVQPRDTLIGLGHSYLRQPGDYRKVQALNQISRPKALRAGRTLLIDPQLLKTTPIDARLSAFSGQVDVETNGQRAPARVGMTIQEGQRIITGPGAFATFEMEDASRVTLPSNTAVRVERLRSVVMTRASERVFKLEQGRSAIQATPSSNPHNRFEVQTPVSISAVRGTEFRVGAFEYKAQTEVIKGAVAVGLGQTSPSVTPVPAGFGVTASRAGVSPPVVMLPPPRLQEGQRQTDRTVRFTLQPVTGANGYRLQLARDAGFVDLFAEATQSATIVDFGALENGTYFVRLTALDAGGLEGLPADYSFDRDLDVLEPGAAPIADRNGKHRNFLFRWSAAGDGVRTFRFQLFSGAETTKPIVDQPGLSEPHLTLTDLPPGAYSWRVSATRFKNGSISEKVGPLQSLQIGR